MRRLPRPYKSASDAARRSLDAGQEQCDRQVSHPGTELEHRCVGLRHVTGDRRQCLQIDRRLVSGQYVRELREDRLTALLPAEPAGFIRRQRRLMNSRNVEVDRGGFRNGKPFGL